MIRFDDATQAQIDAMAPDRSTWLSANAGSGKTRVLTNRVALLLLGGTSPQNIVCLTYTKAAASEMQNRLFQRLGEWAMLPDDRLTEELHNLGVSGPIDADRLASARTLFAMAIETPGGLRIQTIHSFCASILRRFPLEAGISPMFRELDDRAQRDVQMSILRDIASGPASTAMDGISRNMSGSDYDDVIKAVTTLREGFDTQVAPQEIRRWFGLSDTTETQDPAAELLTPDTVEMLKRVEAALHETGQTNAIKRANALGDALATIAKYPTLEPLFGIFLQLKDGEWIVSGAARPRPFVTAHPDLADQSLQFAEALLAAHQTHRAEQSAQTTTALYQFARVFLQHYEDTKKAQGWLDFDDQIAKAKDLLTDRAVCDWVMFRLDGGIDHILVDESQDTSPAQWEIIKLLAQDFGREQTGDRQRTIFVVGDKKQSIYSFQGADPEGFDFSRDHFRDQLMQVAQDLQDRQLRHSFRSAPAILTVVDKVFEGMETGGFTGDPHIAFNSQMPGRVDIWQPLEKPAKPTTPPWYDLSDPPESGDADRILADHIAENIDQMIRTAQLTTSNGETRRVHAGDILILVQRRKEQFHHIIRACKRLNLPIAGADRLRINEELAVKDLRALLSFLALPQDSLSLAAVLRSPLFCWTEKQLFDLANPRKTNHLWDALQIDADKHSDTYPMLKDLRDRADFTAPFDLLDRILTHWGGRQKLLARLGQEAEESIDALLGLARDYEAEHPATLTGFLAWLERDDSDIKRQAESAGNRIRVMTTHGAKGLEAPIVILPETQKPGRNTSPPIVTDAEDRPIWRQNKELATETQLAGTAQSNARADEEHLRLLYVALTRAESWLILCGAGEAVTKPGTWYQRTQTAVQQLGGASLQTSFGEGFRYETGDWPADAPDYAVPGEDSKSALDQWTRDPIIPPAPGRQIVTPSDMKGPKTLGGLEENPDAMAKGSAVHLLLEHTAWARADDPEAAAAALLEISEITLTPDDFTDAIAQARGVLNDPDLAWLFGPTVLAEIPVTAPVTLEGYDQMYGIIDRLVVEEDRVLIVDFKTNVVIPDRPKLTPIGILQQLGVYALAIGQIYPDRRIDCAILWTARQEFMEIPHKIVMSKLGANAAS